MAPVPFSARNCLGISGWAGTASLAGPGSGLASPARSTCPWRAAGAGSHRSCPRSATSWSWMRPSPRPPAAPRPRACMIHKVQENLYLRNRKNLLQNGPSGCALCATWGRRAPWARADWCASSPPWGSSPSAGRPGCTGAALWTRTAAPGPRCAAVGRTAPGCTGAKAFHGHPWTPRCHLRLQKMSWGWASPRSQKSACSSNLLATRTFTGIARPGRRASAPGRTTALFTWTRPFSRA
uniref:Uncharacterized protein n=1 Tax=Ixodes ricinus TaxID=34613 RepID=A0A147BAG0_IXORI